MDVARAQFSLPHPVGRSRLRLNLLQKFTKNGKFGVEFRANRRIFADTSALSIANRGRLIMAENTEEKFPFTVEGEPFVVGEQKPTAKEILKMAQEKGIEPAQDQIEKLVLKGDSAIYKGDETVDLSQDKVFSIGLAVYEFKVNGQELKSNLSKLVALNIIEMAQENGVVLPGTTENLLLSVVGKELEFKNEDWVDLSQFHEFLLILNEQTPVAEV